MAVIVVDDHLLRDVLVGGRPLDLDGLAGDGLATTGRWLFRLCSSFADPTVARKLSAPVAGLPEELQAAFRAALTSLRPEIDVVPMPELAWLMAELQTRHRSEGRPLSAAMVEALAAAQRLDAGIAVSRRDVGPNLRAAAASEHVAFHIL
ncbi:MAG: hypothetical protein ACRD0S_02805 [Acidimicrobiales bacterium]